MIFVDNNCSVLIPLAPFDLFILSVEKDGLLGAQTLAIKGNTFFSSIFKGSKLSCLSLVRFIIGAPVGETIDI